MEKSCFCQEIPLREIRGFLLGHEQDPEAATGCSVVLFPKGAVGGVDVRGGAPGTRETDLLRPENMMNVVHAVLLAGGSAYGLSAASGVMKFLEEKGIGFETGYSKVPIVCGAVLYDLAVGLAAIRPDEPMGYAACKNAFLSASNEIPQDAAQAQGNIGAGTGASVGKLLGMDFAMKSGLGIWAGQVGDLQVGAVVAVNAVGDVVDPQTGEILAGLLAPDKSCFLSTEKVMLQQCILAAKGDPTQKNVDQQEMPSTWKAQENQAAKDLETKSQEDSGLFGKNTTIGVVITNGKLTKAQANKVASMAQNGLARVLRPAHTMFDGDTLFVLASQEVEADISTVGMLSALAVEKAILRGAKAAKPRYGLQAYFKSEERKERP